MILVRTQAELDVALKQHGEMEIELVEGGFLVTLTGTDAPWFVVHTKASLCLIAWGSSQPRVEAWESSQPRVEAWESSQPRVVARGSSQPRVVAWGSSQPRVVARGSSQPRVEACGLVQLSIFGRVIAKASASVAVLIEGSSGKVTGGKQTRRQEIATGKAWCGYYGVPIVRGVAVLYKALDANFEASDNLIYTPGTMPTAPDWDGGEAECGGGLHFSPHPHMAQAFKENAETFVACPVKVSEIVVHKNAQFPEKVKAPRVCAPCWQVDEEGEPVKKT